MIVLAVKPQRLHRVLEELKGSLVKEQLVVSIVAGAKIETIAEQLLHASIVRTMPNTPAQIGEGVTAWTASPEVTRMQESQVCAMLEALGKVCVFRTNDRSTWRRRLVPPGRRISSS
jgi:pyrroline-5-carboxylate reductase